MDDLPSEKQKKQCSFHGLLVDVSPAPLEPDGVTEAMCRIGRRDSRDAMMFSRDPNDVTADDRSQCYYNYWWPFIVISTEITPSIYRMYNPIYNHL